MRSKEKIGNIVICLIKPHKTQGGGIIIFVADHANYVRRTDLESSTIESIWVEFKIPNSSPFLIFSVYRPPSAKAEWIDTFSNQLEKSTSVCNEVYLMGDINIDMPNGTLLNTNWKQQTELFDFFRIVNELTRVTAHSERNNRSCIHFRYFKNR